MQKNNLDMTNKKFHLMDMINIYASNKNMWPLGEQLHTMHLIHATSYNALKKIIQHSNIVEKNTIKTPGLSHIKSNDWEFVYKPAEDTFLLLDALEVDLNFIYSKKPKIVLEVGSGSGVIITALSHVLNSSCHCLAIDINSHACRLTKSTSSHNSCIVDVVQADLTSCLKQNSIDMIVFNPPYVVTTTDEVNSSDLLTKSWAGGIGGTEIINKFLTTLKEVLCEKSFGYLLLLKENQPQEIMTVLKEKQFNCEIIAERKVRGEELFVVKFINRS